MGGVEKRSLEPIISSTDAMPDGKAVPSIKGRHFSKSQSLITSFGTATINLPSTIERGFVEERSVSKIGFPTDPSTEDTISFQIKFISVSIFSYPQQHVCLSIFIGRVAIKIEILTDYPQDLLTCGQNFISSKQIDCHLMRILSKFKNKSNNFLIIS